MSSSSGLDSLIAEADGLAADLRSFGYGSQALDMVERLVSALKATQAGGMLDGQTIEEWRSIADGYHDRADREAFKRYGLERERDDLAEKLAAAEKELERDDRNFAEMSRLHTRALGRADDLQRQLEAAIRVADLWKIAAREAGAADA